MERHRIPARDIDLVRKPQARHDRYPRSGALGGAHSVEGEQRAGSMAETMPASEDAAPSE
jgi:hypothetical protein